MRKIFLLLAIAVFLSGCNTVKGFGKDLGAAGNWLHDIGSSESADEAEDAT